MKLQTGGEATNRGRSFSVIRFRFRSCSLSSPLRTTCSASNLFTQSSGDNTTSWPAFVCFAVPGSTWKEVYHMRQQEACGVRQFHRWLRAIESVRAQGTSTLRNREQEYHWYASFSCSSTFPHEECLPHPQGKDTQLRLDTRLYCFDKK